MANKLLDWIDSHPAIKIGYIADAMSDDLLGGNVDRGYLSRLMNNPEKMPNLMWFRLARALCPYGLELDGWKFYSDEEAIGALFAERWDVEQDEVIEHPRYFEYKRSVYREVFDPFDFEVFIKGE